MPMVFFQLLWQRCRRRAWKWRGICQWTWSYRFCFLLAQDTGFLQWKTHEEKLVSESASVGIQIKYQRPKSSSWKHNMEADAICDEREKKKLFIWSMRQNHNTSHAATSIMQVTRHSTADDVDTRVVPPISTKLYMCKTSMHAFFIRTTTSHKIKKASAFKIKEYAKINHHLLSDLEQLLLTQAFVAVCDGRCRCRWRSQWKIINSTSAFVSPCRWRSLRRWSRWRPRRQLNTATARTHNALCGIPLESTAIRWVHPDIVLTLAIAGATGESHCVRCDSKWKN